MISERAVRMTAVAISSTMASSALLITAKVMGSRLMPVSLACQTCLLYPAWNRWKHRVWSNPRLARAWGVLDSRRGSSWTETELLDWGRRVVGGDDPAR